MQDISFDPRNPYFEFNGLQLAVEIFTFENVYGLRRESCQVTQDTKRLTVDCQELSWAGGQERAEGFAKITATAHDDRTVISLEAGCQHTIRCVKLILKAVPVGEVVGLREVEQKAVPPEGWIMGYPDGWRHLFTPLLILKQGEGQYFYCRSLDNMVREKRLALLPQKEGLKIELIFEENAIAMTNRVNVPSWEIGRADSLEAIYRQQQAFIEQTYSIPTWEVRTDVPGWARNISLIAAVHCQHWTGYVFNDYAQVLERIKWLTQHIEPARLLVYLPGWEGRYYWQYGDYRPDPRMGGADGFAELCQSARAMGVHLMPMFGINMANRGIANFEQWGAPAMSSPAGGIPGIVGADWNGARHMDNHSNALLNPGAPTWQNRLVGQIRDLAEHYGFDGAFLDISAGWINDPRYNTYEGVAQLVGRLRENRPDFWVSGEGWYDGIAPIISLVQSGHSDGVLNWHDTPFPEIFDKYNRAFAHLCLGDPGRGSTGVHELGYNPISRSPLRKGIIPTVTIVEDTLEKAEPAVRQIIADAQEYARRYLAPLPPES